jgi:hypothetical protein
MRGRWVEVRESTLGGLTGTLSRLLRNRTECIGRRRTWVTRRRLPRSPQPIEQGWCGDSIRLANGCDRPRRLLEPDVQVQRPRAWFRRVLKPLHSTRPESVTDGSVQGSRGLSHIRRCHPISCGQISFGKKKATLATPQRTRLTRPDPQRASPHRCRGPAGVPPRGLRVTFATWSRDQRPSERGVCDELATRLPVHSQLKRRRGHLCSPASPSQSDTAESVGGVSGCSFPKTTESPSGVG